MCTHRYRKIAGDVCVEGVSAQFLSPSDCGEFLKCFDELAMYVLMKCTHACMFYCITCYV